MKALPLWANVLRFGLAVCGDGNGGATPQGPQTLVHALSECRDGTDGAMRRHRKDMAQRPQKLVSRRQRSADGVAVDR